MKKLCSLVLCMAMLFAAVLSFGMPALAAEDEFPVSAYLLEESYASYCFIVITNNSSKTVAVSGSAVARDDAGKMLGAANMSIDVLGPGETTIGDFYFSGVSGIANVEYDLDFGEPYSFYRPVLSDLSLEAVRNGQVVAAKVTNNGSTCAQYIQFHALFFDAANNVVAHEYTYVGDAENEIKPDVTIGAQVSTREDFDHCEVYLVGSSNGKAPAAGTMTSADFDAFNDIITWSSSSSTWYLFVKSNASAPAALKINAVASDQEGNLLGASNGTIDVLGPGETSVAEFYFSGVTNIDHINYQIFIDEDPYYVPVVGGLEVESSINDSNVVVAVKNNGETAAMFVQAYLILYDADGNLVDIENNYVGDSDSEIKPGKTEVKQVNVYGVKSFASAEVYLVGRGKK